MHRDEWTANAEIKTGDGQIWGLRYYVRVTENHEPPLYGLKVEKYAADGQLTETGATPMLTTSYAEASTMAVRFAGNAVTPSVLLEVTDEYRS